MAEAVTDPVCQMRLDEAGVKERLAYEGREYYFCSVGCLSEFRRHPEDYAADEPPEEAGEDRV
jgi:P-type Cu+ transporter